jgi:hypothetical protein
LENVRVEDRIIMEIFLEAYDEKEGLRFQHKKYKKGEAIHVTCRGGQ